MPPIYVYVWFDIEDYVTKESDDLPLVAFGILEKYGVRATCKVVAEKIRSLEENGRADVISAISHHAVGFHLDKHSQHPTLYEYVANLDVRSGSEEFVTREWAGLEKVTQTFSRDLSCFGHPGPTWAPHVYPALSKMKIPVYLDETSILNLHNQPYWYCGVLNLNGANENFISFDYTFERQDGLKILKRRFKKIHDAVQQRGGGAVSVLFHLHTAINKKFWDEINFADGKNVRKEEYKRPPTQPPDITERAWMNFEELVRYMASFNDVKFITASDAPEIYRREIDFSLGKADLGKVAEHFLLSSNYVEIDGNFLSPAEAFYVVTAALSDNNSESMPRQVKEPLGPVAPFHSVGKKILRTMDFLAAAKVTLNYMERENFLPTRIIIEDYAKLSPSDFLVTACKLLLRSTFGRPYPAEVTVLSGKSPNEKYISAAAFRSACKWKVLPHNFKAPKILEQIRLQAWTLKPAVVSKSLEPA